MFLKLASSFVTFSLLISPLFCFAQSAESARRKGFYQHKAEEHQADIERERGLREYLREQAEWEEQRQRDRKADQKRKKVEAPSEDGPEYKADLRQRYLEYEEQERLREKHVLKKKAEDAKDYKEQAARDAWSMEELGLDQQRPRFDIAKRSMFGGKSSKGSPMPGFSSGTFGGSSSGSGSGAGSYNPPPANNGNSFGAGNPAFPEPPPYNEFDNYVPPPPFQDPNGTFYPPQDGFAPAPAFPAGEGEGTFYPPPPPPPPGWDGY